MLEKFIYLVETHFSLVCISKRSHQYYQQYLNGRVYIQCGKSLRPAMIEFKDKKHPDLLKWEEAEKSRSKRRLVPKTTHSPGLFDNRPNAGWLITSLKSAIFSNFHFCRTLGSIPELFSYYFRLCHLDKIHWYLSKFEPGTLRTEVPFLPLDQIMPIGNSYCSCLL